MSRNATLSIRNNCYSVPSQLIGERVEVRIYGGHLEVWYGGALVERLERLRGEGRVAINYRHIIHSLVRKPGAFAHYRFQASLFPRLIFRVAYDELRQASRGKPSASTCSCCNWRRPRVKSKWPRFDSVDCSGYTKSRWRSAISHCLFVAHRTLAVCVAIVVSEHWEMVHVTRRHSQFVLKRLRLVRRICTSMRND